jgi:hypothetical protein
MAEKKEPVLTVEDLVAVYNRAPDLMKAFHLEDPSWLGKPCTEEDYMRLDSPKKPKTDS